MSGNFDDQHVFPVASIYPTHLKYLRLTSGETVRQCSTISKRPGTLLLIVACWITLRNCFACAAAFDFEKFSTTLGCFKVCRPLTLTKGSVARAHSLMMNDQ